MVRHLFFSSQDAGSTDRKYQYAQRILGVLALSLDEFDHPSIVEPPYRHRKTLRHLLCFRQFSDALTAKQARHKHR